MGLEMIFFMNKTCTYSQFLVLILNFKTIFVLVKNYFFSIFQFFAFSLDKTLVVSFFLKDNSTNLFNHSQWSIIFGGGGEKKLVFNNFVYCNMIENTTTFCRLQSSNTWLHILKSTELAISTSFFLLYMLNARIFFL